MEFLLSHQFDFNKVFYEGVYFVSREAEKNLKQSKGHNILKKNLENSSKLITPDMIAFRAMHEEKIKAFFENYACIGEILEISIKYMKVRVYMNLEEFLMRNYRGLVEVTYDSEVLRDRTIMMIKRFFFFIWKGGLQWVL